MKPLLLPVFLIFTSIMLSACNSGHESWHYKMTVTVETPEGDISGSAVRVMANSSPALSLPDAGSSASVRGEAVVVDLGERGVLFALISHDSDQEFYETFPVPNNKGGATPEGIAYYASLPAGKKKDMNPFSGAGYPKLVAFKDMNDPKTVTLLQEYERCRAGSKRAKACKEQGPHLINDRFEEMFGEGVRIKNITLEITDEPVTWGVVDQYLPPKARGLNMTYSYFSWPNKVARMTTEN